MTGVSQSDTPTSGYTTFNYVNSAPLVPGTDVTLLNPTLTASAEVVPGTSISYSAGTLSFTGSADYYFISLQPDANGRGIIISPTVSVDFPADIDAIITSTSDSCKNWDVNITPANFSSGISIDLFIAFYAANGYFPESEYVVVYGAASTSEDLIP